MCEENLIVVWIVSSWSVCDIAIAMHVDMLTVTLELIDRLSLLFSYEEKNRENVSCRANHSIAYRINRTKEGQLHRIEFFLRSAENKCEWLTSDCQ